MAERLTESEKRLLVLQKRRVQAHRLLPQLRLSGVAEAISFARERKILMVWGRSSLPLLTEAVVGRLIRGSWMADPEVHRIHDLTKAVVDSLEFFEAPLILGKGTLIHRALGAAVERVASDRARVKRARARLPASAIELLAAVEKRGAISADEGGAPAQELRKARLLLERELLVVSHTIHAERGRHVPVIEPWGFSTIARRFGRAAQRRTYEQAQDQLVMAALRAAVVVAEREARRWFVFGPDAIDRLIALHVVTRITAGRTSWLALTTESR